MTEKITKRQKIFHPFLVAFFPILIIYSVNTGRIELEEFILPTILIVGGALLFFFGLKHILKNVKKTALVVTLSFIIFFSYGHVYNILNSISIGDIDLGSNLILGPIFVLLFGIGTFLIIKTKRVLDNATSITNVIAIVFILVAIVNVAVVSAELTQPTFDKHTRADVGDLYEKIDFSSYFEPHTFSISESNSLPNVYYIILDGYPRNDALKKHVNFDNSEFLNFLKQRGFHIVENAYSNYSQSLQSIPATMNMNYINFLADEIGKDARSYKPYNGKDFGLYSDNQVMKNFKSMGYKIVNFNTFSLHFHELPLADLSVCHKTSNIMDNRLLDTVGRSTMIGYFIERWSENEDRQVILCTFEELPKVNESFDEPVFVWAHIMLPHPPLIFGPNGEAVTPGKPLLIMNHPDFRNSGWDIKQQFVQQLQFTNKKSMEFIDKVLDDGKRSIIIIQGDHGSGFNINWQDPTDDNVIQRLSTFNAIYFPDEEHKEIITDDQTLVNTFRIVFNSYFGSDYEILEDKMYWGYNEKPYMFKDVTSILLEKP